MPHINLNDNYSEQEKANLSWPGYHAFTEKSDGYFPSRHSSWASLREPFQDRVGDNALHLLTPQKRTRTFAFINARVDSQDNGMVVLNLKKVLAEEQKVGSQISYISHEHNPWCNSPSFSPDGKNMLMQSGYPPDYGEYASVFFIWEQTSGRLRAMHTNQARLNRVLWSPGSRFLSYLHGGKDYNAPMAGPPDPYELWCMDVASRREHLVIKDPGFDWSWTYHGQILCSSLSQKATTGSKYSPRQTIYEVNATGGAPRKLFESGFFPTESPDGRWIAFYDWPAAWYKTDLASGVRPDDSLRARLCLFDRKTRKRQWVAALDMKPEGYGQSYQYVYTPLFQWSPDGRFLFVFTQSADFNEPQKGTLYRMDMKSRVLSTLATLPPPSEMGSGYFRLRGISADGLNLYIEFCTSIEGIPGASNTHSTLHSIDTRSGDSTAVAQVFNIGNENPGWDFHEEGVNPAFAAAERLERTLDKSMSAGTEPRPHRAVPKSSRSRVRSSRFRRK